MNWLGRISHNRTQAQGHVGPEAGAKGAAGKPEAAAFADTLISDKVLARYGAALAPAANDMQAIARGGAHLATHNAARFANAVDQFYSALGRSTDHLVEPTRGEVVSASAKAMRGLVTSLGQHPALMPAMAALTSLLEPRKAVDVAPSAHADAAKKTVLDLVESLDGRLGAGSMLFGFRNLVEAYESSQEDLTAKGRPEVWARVVAYLDEVVPRAGCDQGELGRVAGLFHRNLRATPEDPNGALDRAAAAALEPLVAPREAAHAQLEVPAPEIPADGPGAQAHQALVGALQQVLADNPAGPATLVAAVEALAGTLRGQMPQVADDATRDGYLALADAIKLASKTPAAQPMLEAMSAHGPAMARHDGARRVLARVARVQKPESLAPILVEAYAAVQNQGEAAAELTAAVGKLKRLPPGPALNASLALLPHFGKPSLVGLAEALHVESRRAETPEALRGFAERFTAAQPTLHNKLGEDAQAVAVALARSTTGALQHARINRVADVCAAVKGILPTTPLAKLLEPGREGQAGLLQLAEQGVFIHDPLPMLYDLMRAAAGQAKGKAKGKEMVGEARLAMHIASQLGFFDRDPRATDFPRVLDDFTQALAKPRTLSWPQGGGGAAQVKAGRGSALAFVDAHPDIPAEIALTVGRALDEGQLGWLTQTLESSRSHAFNRAVRDALFAAVSTDRLDFVAALTRPDLDREAMTAAVTLVAREHRQGNAAAVPFDRLVAGLNAGKDPVGIIETEKAAKVLQDLKLDGLEQVDPEGMARIERVMPQIQSLLGFFEGQRYNAPPEHFMPHLNEIVKQQAEGTWPNYKVTTEAAKEHLQGLSDAQVQTWFQESVTGTAAPIAADDPEALEAMVLLRGLAAKLHRTVDLKGKGFENVGWSKASLAELTKRRDGLVDELRRKKKGSRAHRKLSGQIGPVQARVALLELHLALKDTFKGEPGPAQAVLSRVGPLAGAAVGPLRKMRQAGFVQALESVMGAVKEAPADPRKGTYAADEDHLEAYMTSFSGGSCINPSNGFNRGALVELMGGSQYKMIRAMEGDKSIGRAFLRFIKVKLPNGYEGHALAMDRPKSTTDWGKPSAQYSNVMYEHALGKAMALGVPLLVQENDVGGAAKARGLKLESMKCECHIHKGITGMHHNEGLSGGDYFINWPGMAGTPRGYDVPNDDDSYAIRSYNLQVVMPKA